MVRSYLKSEKNKENKKDRKKNKERKKEGQRKRTSNALQFAFEEECSSLMRERMLHGIFLPQPHPDNTLTGICG